MKSMKLTHAEAYKENQEQQILLDRLEVTVRNRLIREINRYIRRVAAVYPDQLQIAFEEQGHIRRIVQILTKNIQKTAPIFGRLVRKQIEAEVKTVPTFYQSIAEQWILERGLEQATGIAQTTTQMIRAAIAQTVVETVSVSVVSKAIRSVMGMTAWRAAMIARTETHNAALYASERSAIEASADLGIELQKFWIPVLDARTRDNHAAMINHQGIDLDENFNVGGVMMSRPSDPKGGAGNNVNCRCAMVYRRKQFEIEG